MVESIWHTLGTPYRSNHGWCSGQCPRAIQTKLAGVFGGAAIFERIDQRIQSVPHRQHQTPIIQAVNCWCCEGQTWCYQRLHKYFYTSSVSLLEIALWYVCFILIILYTSKELFTFSNYPCNLNHTIWGSDPLRILTPATEPDSMRIQCGYCVAMPL